MSAFFLRILIVCVMIATTAFAQSAYEIAKSVYDLPSAKTSSATISITLINKKGKTRNREVVSYTKKDGTTEKLVMVFKIPKDVAGISYLSFSYPNKKGGTEKESDSWIYLPAMKKVRRIAGASKNDDFQGTDFTYDDISNRDLSKDHFAILGEEKIDGDDYWILEAKAKDPKAKVSRRVSWINKKKHIVRKGEYYDQQNRLLKELDCESVQQVKGYWSILKMTMTNVQTNHKTIYEVKDLKYDEPVNASYFTISALEREQVK